MARRGSPRERDPPGRELDAVELLSAARAIRKVERQARTEAQREVDALALEERELGSLTWVRVDLEAALVTIPIPARSTKNRRDASLPIRADVVEALKAWKGEAEPDAAVFSSVPLVRLPESWTTPSRVAPPPTFAFAIRPSCRRPLSRIGTTP